MIRINSLPRAALAALALLIAAAAAAAEPTREQRFLAEWEAGQDAFNLGRYPEARRHFTRARDLDPTRPGPHRWLGRVARVLEDWDGCVASATTAIRLKPDSPRVAEVRKDLDACRSALGRPVYGRPLSAGQGALAVVANVEGATVTVDGIGKGATPVEPMPLNQGRHRLRVAAAGFAPAELDVEVVPGITVDGVVALRPLERARPRSDR